MANQSELRQLSRARIKTVRTLINGEDWDAAAYMMGYVLELALKAASCKALKLKSYPANASHKTVANFFQSHIFDQLIVISGLSDLFSLDGTEESHRNWSLFVQEYPWNWPEMRYDPNIIVRFDESKINNLYTYLYDDEQSIIKTIAGKRRW